jgi:hypothetical protein
MLALALKLTVVVPVPLAVSVIFVSWSAPIASENGPNVLLVPTMLSASAIRSGNELSSPIV